MSLRKAFSILLMSGLLVGHVSSAHAQETVTYTYDALGRLTVVQHAGGPAAGTSSTYNYDAADNRTSVVVTGSPNGSGNGSDADGGASTPTVRYVVVPLNGFTVIQIPY